MQAALQHPDIQRAFVRCSAPSSSGRQLVTVDPEIFSSELDQLIGGPFFGRFDHTQSIKDINWDDAYARISTVAPMWVEMLDHVLSNRRAGWGSYAAPKQESRQSVIFHLTADPQAPHQLQLPKV